MTPDECNDALRENIDESVQCALELRDLLTDERTALERQDTMSLSDTAVQKSRCVNSLEQLDRARLELSKTCGFGISPNEIAKLTESCDESGLLPRTWSQFLEVAHECDAMNSGNGAIIRVRQKQINSALNLLRDGTAESDTYGPSGHSSEDSRTRSLAEA